MTVEHPTPLRTSAWSLERIVQLVVLLVGGGIGGVIATLATTTVESWRLAQQAESQNTEFVQKYLKDIIDKDIHTRFRIAEYFTFVLTNDEQRRLWKNYLGELENKYSAMNDEQFRLLQVLDPKSSELTNFAEARRLKRIEFYLGEARDLKPPVAQPAPLGDTSKSQTPAAKKANAEYQVLTQFAGLLQRDKVRLMMQDLADKKWDMKGVSGGGERTPAAAGVNEVRYGVIDDQPAADELAKQVQASGLPGKSVISSLTSGIRPGTLEIWISN